MFKQTALSSIDSYKLGHAEQYPQGTTKVYSNFTPRSNSHFNVPEEYKTDEIVWFGLQIFLNELKAVWDETFFQKPNTARRTPLQASRSRISRDHTSAYTG